MAKQSSKETRSRAQRLADAIGCYHLSVDIVSSYEKNTREVYADFIFASQDNIFAAQKDLLTQATGFTPAFRSDGGQPAEK